MIGEGFAVFNSSAILVADVFFPRSQKKPESTENHSGRIETNTHILTDFIRITKMNFCAKVSCSSPAFLATRASNVPSLRR